MNEQPSGLYQTSSRLGMALGLAAAIFLTPLLYGWGKTAVSGYLLAKFGAEYAPYLLLATGGIEAYVIYACCQGVVTFLLTWAMTALAARGLSSY